MHFSDIRRTTRRPHPARPIAPVLAAGQRLAVRLLAVLLLAALSGAPANAQAPINTPQIDTATLRLWPEYDDPGLLVILDGAFVTDTAQFPLAVSFPIAAAPRGVQATEKTAAGQMLSQPWQIDGGNLTYSLPGPSFQVEYYLDRPPAANGLRTIEYTFKAPYAIRQLAVDVAQPARATGFSLTPTAQAGAPAPDGLTHFTVQRSNVAAGETLAFTIRYTKNDAEPSFAPSAAAATAAAAPGAAAPMSGGAAGGTAASGGPGNWLPWLLIGLGGAALLGAAGYWVWQQQGARSAAPRPKGARRSAALPTAARQTTPPRAGVRPMAAGRTPAASDTPTTPGEAVFCPRCGNRLKPEDQFCSQCGAPRRR